MRRPWPADWDVAPLAELLRRPPAYGINAAAVAYTPSHPAYIRITDIGEDGTFRPSPRASVKHAEAHRYVLEDGDLVFARTGASVGKSYRYRHEDGVLVFAGFLIRISPNPTRLLPEFLSQFVQTQSYWDWIKVMSVRSGQPGVNGQEYGKMPVPVPHIDEQRAIVATLQDMDFAAQSLEQLIAKKRLIKGGLSQQLLSGNSRLPGFTIEWSRAPIGSISTVTMGQSPSGSSYNAAGKGMPLIQGNADIADRRTISRIWTTEPSKRCKVGAIVMTVRAPVGFAALASQDACLGRGVCSIEAGRSNSFLFHALVHGEPRWSALQQGSTFTAVNSLEVRSFSLDWPSDPDERAAIGSVLDEAEEEIAGLERRLVKLHDVKIGTAQELFSGLTRLSNLEGAS